MPGSGWAGHKETHVSAVYFVGDMVLKLKKPVRNDFLDFATAAARRHACREEVRLNSRLSPDVYLGVAEIDLGGADPEPGVVMRRLRDADALTAVVGTDERRAFDGLEQVARQIAALHERALPVTAAGSPSGWALLVASWEREWDALERLDPSLALPHRRAAARSLGATYLAGRRALFDSRRRDGKIRDGHGDLRADHVYLTTDGVRIVDCLEFDASLRTCDVLADVAFLAMDLERLDAPAAAMHMLAAYRELAADVYPSSLVDFYVAQRALVRLKVTLLRSGPRTRRAMQEADCFLEIAETHLADAQPVVAQPRPAGSREVNGAGDGGDPLRDPLRRGRGHCVASRLRRAGRVLAGGTVGVSGDASGLCEVADSLCRAHRLRAPRLDAGGQAHPVRRPAAAAGRGDAWWRSGQVPPAEPGAADQVDER